MIFNQPVILLRLACRNIPFGPIFSGSCRVQRKSQPFKGRPFLLQHVQTTSSCIFVCHDFFSEVARFFEKNESTQQILQKNWSTSKLGGMRGKGRAGGGISVRSEGSSGEALRTFGTL